MEKKEKKKKRKKKKKWKKKISENSREKKLQHPGFSYGLPLQY
jgi:hypothetical protein